MCMEDIRIGRKTGVAQQLVPLPANTVVQVVDANRLRTGLLIGSLNAQTLWLGFDKTVAIGSGLLIPANSVPLKLLLAEMGELVRRPIYGITNAAINVMIFEFILDDDAISTLGPQPTEYVYAKPA